MIIRRFAGAAKYSERLAGLRVAHLTDLHVGRMTPWRVQQRAVRATNAQNPDLVAITGDFVNHSQLYLDQLRLLIRSIDAPVVCVLGNHDHWSGAGEVRTALQSAGAEVLDNANTVITLRGHRLQLVGLDDAYTGHADRGRAVKGLRPDLPTLGLSHIAEEADYLWTRGVPLVLAGHTHGGQITWAGLQAITLGRIAGHRYLHGLYGDRGGDGRSAKGAVYVGAGIGAAVMPVRLGERARREIAIFELGSVPGSFAEHHLPQQPLPGRAPSPRTRIRRAATVARKQRRRSRRGQRRIRRGRFRDRRK